MSGSWKRSRWGDFLDAINSLRRTIESEESSPVPAQKGVGADPFMRWVSTAGIASFFFALIAYNFVDVDLWHQMALVRESLRAGHLLRTDPFAYTPTIQPWIDHEWGAGAIAFFATKWFGGSAIVALKFLLAFATGMLCIRTSEKSGADFRLVALCAPTAIFLAQLGFLAAIRAQVYSFFFAALLIWFLQIDGEGNRKWMFIWLTVFPLWVNLHGGFVVGFGLLALHVAEELLWGRNVRHLLLVLAVMLGEVFLTPYGIDYLSYLGRALFMSRPFAPEWRPVWDLGLWWVTCFATAVAVAVYAAVRTGVRKAPGALILGATICEATLHRKLLPFFALAWLCYVPALLQRTEVGEWVLAFMTRRRRFALATWATLACVSLASAFRQKPWDPVVPQPIYPVGAVNYLAEQKFSGNLMVPFRLGAYVSWKLFPQVKVSLDGRYEEIYSNRVMEQIFDLYEARCGWQSTLALYPADAVLVPRDVPIAGHFAETGWRRSYRDREFDIYLRPGLSLRTEDWSLKSFQGSFP